IMRSTFGAPLGGTTRGGHQGVESLALSLITPPNFSGGAGSCSPLMVVVALAEAGEPVISWAGVGSATNIAQPAASSDKPFWINFRFIVFCVWVLVYLGIGEKSVSLVDSQDRILEETGRFSQRGSLRTIADCHRRGAVYRRDGSQFQWSILRTKN